MAHPHAQPRTSTELHLAFRGGRCPNPNHRGEPASQLQPLGRLPQQHDPGRDHFPVSTSPDGIHTVPERKTIGSSTPADDLLAEFPDVTRPSEFQRTVRRDTVLHLRTPPDNRTRRADPLTCSLAGSPHPSGQQATQGRLAYLQLRRISAQRQTTSCPGHTHSPAATPDHCATSPTDYPGTQMPVAGRQRYTAPDLRPPPYGINTTPSFRPSHPLPGAVQRVSTILRGGGVMWGRPTSLSAALFRAPRSTRIVGHPF
jgi:hypothetical protein